jgi:hypothetical protein
MNMRRPHRTRLACQAAELLGALRLVSKGSFLLGGVRSPSRPILVAGLGENSYWLPSVLIGGTATVSNVVTLTFTNPLINSGTPVHIAYAVQANDTPTTIAAGLTTAINGNGSFTAAAIQASAAIGTISFLPAPLATWAARTSLRPTSPARSQEPRPRPSPW